MDLFGNNKRLGEFGPLILFHFISIDGMIPSPWSQDTTFFFICLFLVFTSISVFEYVAILDQKPPDLMSYGSDIDGHESNTPPSVTSHSFRTGTIPLSNYSIVNL